MDNLTPSRVWLMRLLYVGLALVILFFHLLPLSTLPPHWSPPDLLIVLTFAWALRRPDYVPSLLIAAVMLLADLLLQRPPGLMAALVVAGSAFLKIRVTSHGESGFLTEWFATAVVLVAIMILNRMVLAITAVDQAPLLLVLIQLVLSILIYPLMVWVSQSIFGVRKLAPADAGALGARA